MSSSAELVDAEGRWVIVREETCVHCGRSSSTKHPGGVVPGRWLCSCGRRQNKPELIVTWRRDLPIHCGGCGRSFVPPDGKVLGVDDDHLTAGDIWPVVRCPGCGETVACSMNHVAEAEIRE